MDRPACRLFDAAERRDDGGDWFYEFVLPAARKLGLAWGLDWSAKATNFTVLIQDFQNWNDNTLNPNRNTTNAIASCDYMVKSGSGAGNGPNDPSLVVTKPWTSRPCNANVTITVGTTGMCNVIGTSTCRLTRAHTVGGQIGNVTYQVYSIDY